jgi:DNA-directed RNA polymerase specialized sigma24 family protein
VDYARHRRAQQRGGLFELTALSTDAHAVPDMTAELVRIGEAVDDLFNVEPMLAEVVDLKYFCGFSFEEIAAMKGLSERTVRRQWTKARAYLHATMSDDDPAV